MKPQQQIPTTGGDVWYALKSTEDSFLVLEKFTSWVESGAIKAWKMHLQMTMNLIVPLGTVRFIFHEYGNGSFREERIGKSYYARITVPPKIWFGFQGISGASSLMLNVANMPHDPKEIERKSLEEIRFDWQEVE